MIVRKAKVETVDDLERLPEGEWVAAPDGIRVDFEYEGIRVEPGRLRIRLSRTTLQRFRPQPGASLRARIADGELIVEEIP